MCWCPEQLCYQMSCQKKQGLGRSKSECTHQQCVTLYITFQGPLYPNIFRERKLIKMISSGNNIDINALERERLGDYTAPNRGPP